MFKVKYKSAYEKTARITTVYSVDVSDGYTKFLIYVDKEWRWILPKQCVPAEADVPLE